MPNSSAIFGQKTVNGREKLSLSTFTSSKTGTGKFNPVFEILHSEGREDFARFILSCGFDSKSEILLIPSTNHYFYDTEEMKNVSAVINIMELNHIKHLKKFLHTISEYLPQRSNFIGCFVDNDRTGYFEMFTSSANPQKDKRDLELENGIMSKYPILNMVYNLIDSKTRKYLSGSSVFQLLEESGFKIKRMSKINGLTFFHAQKDDPEEN